MEMISNRLYDGYKVQEASKACLLADTLKREKMERNKSKMTQKSRILTCKAFVRDFEEALVACLPKDAKLREV